MKVRPGSSPGYLVNKQFPLSIFMDNQLSQSKWNLPANKRFGAIERDGNSKENLAVTSREESKNSLTIKILIVGAKNLRVLEFGNNISTL